MIRLTLIVVVVLSAIGLVSAQNNEERNEGRREMRQEQKAAKAVAAAPAAPSASAVGEPDSFGKNAVFLGVAASGGLIITNDCSDPNLDLQPDDKCLQVLDPTISTTQDFTDLARITIPGKSVSNIVYCINNHTINYHFSNPGPGTAHGRLTYSPTITIESDALNDPSAIDPNTNLPMNGKYTTSGNGTRAISRTLPPGTNDSDTLSYSRANTLGFSRTFWAGLGLSQNVINNIYKKPMTIRLGIHISVLNVDFGNMLYTARFLGN
ncbi:MAG: hypothetical protein ACJ73D_00935 [Pyrinomonadaceae bacterium]